MAIAGGIGATVEAEAALPHAFWFGEDQARYIVTVPAAAAPDIAAKAQEAGIPVLPLGQTGGATLTIGGGTAILVSDLVRCHEDWLPAYMGSELP
jgi:phosphoribosylformylglycinamidine synthase